MKYIKSKKIFESLVKKLDYSNKGLTELPELPTTLERLDCSNNQLKELPSLPDTLEELDCSNNQLPFNNLKEYKEWIKLDKHLTLKEKYKKAQRELKIKKFNI